MSSYFALDVRYALRSLAHNRSFAAAAVLTLALGIGGNTAIFSIVNGVVLQPLPYKDPERLVAVREHREQRGFERTVMARAEFLRWLRASRTVQDAAAVQYPGLAVRIDDTSERLAGLEVTPSFFNLLGVRVALGRGMTAADAAPGAPNVALVSHAIWKERFAADFSLVGRTLLIEGLPRTIIGILAPRFEFNGRVDIVTPLRFTSADEAEFGTHYLEVYARLRPGVTREAAETELSTIALSDQGPTMHERGVTVVPLQELLVGDAGRPMVLLLGAVVFVLFIACANIANLQLARGESRLKEVAIRAALGAGRGRILRQLVTENVVLATIGGTLGVLVALWGVDALVAVSPPNTPRLSEVVVNGRVLLFALGITGLAALLFGIVPALTLSRADLNDTIKRDTRSGQAVRHRALALFVASEVALAVMLTAGAGLLLATFANLRAVRPGFDPAGVATVSISIPAQKYVDADSQRRFVEQVVSTATAIPGVTAAGAVNALPLSGDNSSTTITIDGVAFVDGPNRPNTNYRTMTPGYLEAMNIRVVRGRTLTDVDSVDAPKVALVNETMAERFWPGQDPIGRRFKRGRPQSQMPWLTIVGVVGDVRHAELRQPPRQEMYVPFAQSPADFVVLAIRSTYQPAQLRKPLQQGLRRIDPDIPLTNLRALSDTVGASLAMSQFETALVAGFALVGLLLASGGIYGVTAYAVAQRTREFGIRLALGAQWRDVAGMVVRHAAAIAGAGVVAGLGGAAIVTRVLESLLYGIEPGDPRILVATALTLTMIVLVACLVPARRAATVDPAIALRGE